MTAAPATTSRIDTRQPSGLLCECCGRVVCELSSPTAAQHDRDHMPRG
jgi:hypothetical protein